MKRSSIVTGLACMVMGLSAAPQLAVAGGTKSSPSKTEETKKKTEETKKTDTKSKDTVKTGTETTRTSKSTTKSGSGDVNNTYPLSFDGTLVHQPHATITTRGTNRDYSAGAMDLAASVTETYCPGRYYPYTNFSMLAVGQQGSGTEGGHVSIVHAENMSVNWDRTLIFTGDSSLDDSASRAEVEAARSDASYGKAIDLIRNSLLIASNDRLDVWTVNPICSGPTSWPEKELEFTLDSEELFCPHPDWNADALQIDDVAFAAVDDKTPGYWFFNAPKIVSAAITDGNHACVVTHTLDGRSDARASLPTPMGTMQLGSTPDGVAVSLVAPCESTDGSTCMTTVATTPTSVLDDVGQAVLERYDVGLDSLGQITMAPETLGAELADVDLATCVDECMVPSLHTSGNRGSGYTPTESECMASCTTLDLSDGVQNYCASVSNMSPWIFMPEDDSDAQTILGDYGLSEGLPDAHYVTPLHQVDTPGDRMNAVEAYSNRVGGQTAHVGCADFGSYEFDSGDLFNDGDYGFVSYPYYGVVYGGSKVGSDWEAAVLGAPYRLQAEMRFGEDLLAFGDWLIVSSPGANRVDVFERP